MVGLIFGYPTLCVLVCGSYPCEGVGLNPFRGTACVQHSLVIHPLDNIAPQHQFWSLFTSSHAKALCTCSSCIFSFCMGVGEGRWFVCGKGDQWTPILHQEHNSSVAWGVRMAFLLNQPGFSPQNQIVISSTTWNIPVSFAAVVGSWQKLLLLLGNELGLKRIPGDEATCAFWGFWGFFCFYR